VSSFPQPLVSNRDEVTDNLFVDARDAYLAGDWLRAETKLQTILTLSPTDGEAQLLFGTLLRRVGRFEEAKKNHSKNLPGAIADNRGSTRFVTNSH
jgi:Flp pilus assembly protein TadD